MVYAIEFEPQALKELGAIDRTAQRLIREKIVLLGENYAALKNNIIQLKGKQEPLFRLRVADYRIIFSKDEARIVILIVRVRHRREVYEER
jgi:mRNA interferase RelE/StbE